jgi:hypothetical protein
VNGQPIAFDHDLAGQQFSCTVSEAGVREVICEDGA